MESELSLIEMGDDLLVEDLIGEEKIKSTTATTTTSTPLLDLDLDESIIDFSCSPLVIDRSKRSADRPRIPRPEVKGKGEMQKTCFVSPRCVNKENHNENSVGPTSSPDSSHTMKKRKKRGGFNLRKSLAWNKAFFTEEGVLDPLELSRLSHSISKPNGEFLSVVPEEGRTAMIKSSRVCGSGSPLQRLEEDMSSEQLHVKSVNEEDKRTVKNMSPVTLPSIRENAASVSSASRKLQLTKSPYKSAPSGGGCPRPSGSSSQKRLPNASSISSSMKESKLPRRTVLRPESSSISATSKHTVAGAKRVNLKTPTANTEKNVGIKGSLNKTKTAPGLTSSSSKSSALHLGKNMGSKGSSSGLKQTADPVRRADTHIPIDDGGRKVPVSLPQNAHSVSKNIPAQSQPTKPSGLRMPSPSIGYFGQAKASASHSIQSLRNTQPSNVRESSIPNPRKLGHSKQIGATLVGTSRLTKGSTDTKVGAYSLSSMSKCLIPSVAATTSQAPLKSKVQLKNPEVEAKASNCKSVYNQTNSQPELHNMHDIGSGKQEVARNNAHDEGKQIFQENWKLGVNDTSLHVHSKSFEQLQESKLENIMDVSQKTENVSGSELGSKRVPVSLNSKIQVEGVVLADNMIEHNHVERVQLESLNSNTLNGDHNVISNVKFCDDNGVDTSLVHVKSLRDADRVNEISRELLEVIKPGPELSSQNFTVDIEQIRNEEDKRLQISESILVEDQGVSEESQDNDSSVDTSMVHAESLEFFSHHVNEKCGELAEVVKPVLIEVGGIQHTENERLQISDLILMEQGGVSKEAQKDTNNSCVTTSVVHVESSGLAHYVDEKLGEIQHKENERLEISDIILMEQGVVSEEAQKDNHNGGVTTSVVHVESSGFAHYVNEESRDLAEAAKPGSDEVEQIQHMNQQLHLPDSAFVEQRRLSEESQEDNDNNIIAAHEGTSMVHVESFGFAHHVNEKSGVLAEVVVRPGSDEQNQHKENERLKISDIILMEQRVVSEDAQKDDDNSGVTTSVVHVESSGFAHYVNEESGELAEAAKPGSEEVEQIQHMNQQLHLPDSAFVEQQRLSEESQEDNDNSIIAAHEGTSMVHVESFGFAHHVNEKSGVLAEVVVSPGSDEQNQHKENERLKISDIILMEQRVVSEEAQKDDDNSGATTSVLHVESSGFAHYVNEESGELAEAAKPGSDEVEQIQHMNQQLHLPDSAFVEQRRLSEEAQEDNDNNIIAARVGTSIVHVESFGFAHHVNEKSGVLAEVVVRPGSDEQIQHIENQRLHLPDSTLVEPQGLSEESQEDNNNSVIGTLVGHVENLGFAHHVNEESGDLVEVVKPGSDEVEQVQHMEDLRLHLPDSIFVVQRGLSEESHDDNDNTAVGTSMVHIAVDTSMVHVKTLGFAHHVNVKSGDLSEAVKPGSNDVEQIQHMQNQQLQLSDRISVEQCVSSEETQKDNFLGNDTFVSESGCWMGTSDILFRVAPVMQLNEGIAVVDNMKDIQQAESYQFERQDNDSSENRDSISGTEFSDLIDRHTHAHCSRTVDDIDEPAARQIRLRDKSPLHEIKEILHKGDLSFEMNDKTLLLRSKSTEELQKDDHNTLVLQSRSSGESQEDNDIGNVIYVSPKTSNSGGNSCKKSHVLSQLELRGKVNEGAAGNDNTIEHHAVENHESLYDTPCEYRIDGSAEVAMREFSRVDPRRETTLGFISCLELSKQTSDTTTCNLELVSTSSGNTPDHIDDTVSQNDISLHKTETNLSPSIEIPDGEQCESENAASPMKCTDPTLSVKRSSPGYSNHDALTLKYKIKAVPFSDEWLAALEAAGEDILTMKSGAVQNSPTDKSLPEPSPWSPVKRKNQEIGPFDCTKCTNLTPPSIP